MPKKEPASTEKLPGFLPRSGRGRRPVPRTEPPSAAEPLPSFEDLGVPCAARLREALEPLPAPELLRQVDRAARSARQRPPERSPLWWMAYEPLGGSVDVGCLRSAR